MVDPWFCLRHGAYSFPPTRNIPPIRDKNKEKERSEEKVDNAIEEEVDNAIEEEVDNAIEEDANTEEEEEDEKENKTCGALEEPCPICFTSLGGLEDNNNRNVLTELNKNKGGELGLTETTCGHLFHTECLRKWKRVGGKKPTCPLCRNSVKGAKPLLLPKPKVVKYIKKNKREHVIKEMVRKSIIQFKRGL